MSHPLINGKTLLENIKAINEPVTFDGIADSFEGSVKSSEDTSKLKALLASAVRLGFVVQYNNHYFSATHVDDIKEVMEWESHTSMGAVSCLGSIDSSEE